MKNIEKTEIGQNLETLNILYTNSANNREALFYSKLAVLELCAWLEETMEEVVRSYVVLNIKNKENQNSIENSIIRPNHGFDYKGNFRKMLIRVVGFRGIETMEDAAGSATIYTLESTTRTLKKTRDRQVHTYFNTTMNLEAPSIIMGHFNNMFQALEKFQDAMK